MTEGEKQCGLGSFLPISCRGRAEAFARRLHNRLRSLGSHDSDDPHTSENSWLASNEISNSVTSLQPRHSGTEADIFSDFGVFDTPGSPQEELAEHEMSKFITNPTDDLHNPNLDECRCTMGSSECKRNSLSVDSDSSDGQYFDPEIIETEQNNHLANGENHTSDELLPSNIPSSDCTLSSLSQNISVEEESFDGGSFSESPHSAESKDASAWCLNKFPIYESISIPTTNNNIYNAIDLESLKHCIQNHLEDKGIPRSNSGECEESLMDRNKEEVEEEENESYCSHIEIQNDFVVECPCPEPVKYPPSPTVEISALEIIDTDEIVKEEGKEVQCNGKQNYLQVLEHDDIETEERTPRVRRCSSLKTGKTPPGTPGRKKIVRFADVLGLDLADVRTFLDEIPKVPISAYDDLSGVDLTLSETSLSSNSCLETVQLPTKRLMALFEQPGGEATFMDKVRSNLVCLENAVVQDSLALCVCGTVRVRNLDFHKSVHVRYSLDQWKSFADLQATYVDNSCDGFSDKFSFTLYVHTLTAGQRLEFAVRFQCKGCQYWDNNSGANYCFECLPTCASKSFGPIAQPDDTSWEGAAFYY